MKIYTRQGDCGHTALMDGAEIPKCDICCELLGTLDELNSHMGLVRAGCSDERHRSFINDQQIRIMTVSAYIADNCRDEYLIREDDVTELETKIGEMQALYPKQSELVIPGGTGYSAEIDIARAVARRTERVMVAFHDGKPVSDVVLKYMNRLSDYLFVYARFVELSVYSRLPLYVKDNVPYFGSEREGDQFDDDDITFMTSGGGFARRWESRGLGNEYKNAVYMDLCRQAANVGLPVLDIASGPNLGLIPDICFFDKNVMVTATDACPTIAGKWNEFMEIYEPDMNFRSASFNVADMPLKSDSIDVLTSNIGFSSLRYAGDGNMMGVNEAYRVLKPGGYVFAIENEFEDFAVVKKVFDLWGRENWYGQNKPTWRERFESAGFYIEMERHHLRQTENGDWELGRAAESFGIRIAMNYKAYILRKQ